MEEEEEEWPFFMHELVNYGMEGMSRLCDAVVRPSVPHNVGALGGGRRACSPMGAQTVSEF